MQNEFEKWKELAREVISLAQEVIDNSEMIGIEYDIESFVEEGMYKLMSAAFLFSAREDFNAIYLLFKNKLISQAMMIVRHLFELMVDLRYINKCPDDRIKQFWNFDPIERTKWINKLRDYNQLWRINQQKQAQWQIWLEEVMETLGIDKLPRGFEWSGFDKEKMSKEVGLSNQYLAIYKICCSFTHPSPWGFSHCIKQTPDGSIEFNQPYHLKGIFWIAIGYFIDIINNPSC